MFTFLHTVRVALRALVPSALRGRLPDALDPSASAAADASSGRDGRQLDWSGRDAPSQTTLSDMAVDPAEGSADTRSPGSGSDTGGPQLGATHESSTAPAAPAEADDRDDCASDGDGAGAGAGSDTSAYRVPVERRPPCPTCGGVLAQELITEHRPRDTPLVYDGFWCTRCDTGFQQCPTCDQLHRPTTTCPVAALRDPRE